jgi:acetate kinase
MIVLVINCGSSSLKYEVYDMETESVRCKGLVERIGADDGHDAVVHHRPTGRPEIAYESPIEDHDAAVREMARLLTEGEGAVLGTLEEIDAVGHRVVHGGEAFKAPAVVDDDVIAAIRKCANLAPLHNPPNLAGILAARALMGAKPQVAVFDTAFHQTMPRKAFLYAIPYELYKEHGIRRYGFHGTSHFYVASRAAEMLDAMGVARPHRIVTCHLGNGCSMTAVDDGKSVDTSMGLTPLEGLVMGTRCGDIDPAIIPFLEQRLEKSPKAIDRILNRESGLLGISGVSNDMRDVMAAAEAGNRHAQDAVDVFCYRVVKYIGAYAAAMGGLTAVVFTGGIGENNPDLRAAMLGQLAFLGLEVDDAANRDRPRGDRAITTANSKVAAFALGTQEELVIARQTQQACAAAS